MLSGETLPAVGINILNDTKDKIHKPVLTSVIAYHVHSGASGGLGGPTGPWGG